MTATATDMTAKYMLSTRRTVRSERGTHTVAIITRSGTTQTYPAVVESSCSPCHDTASSSEAEASAASWAYHSRKSGFWSAMSSTVAMNNAAMNIILRNISGYGLV